MKVEMNGTHIGYSHTEVGLEDNAGIDQYTVHNVTMLKLVLMGEKQQVRMSSDTLLDGAYGMKSFRFGMSSRNYNLRIDGERVAGEQYDVKIKTGSMNTRTKVRVPADAVIYSPYLELVLKELKPGKSTSLKIFDPMSQRTSVAVITAKEIETLTISGKALETTRLNIKFNNMNIDAWIDEDGQIVRQKTPFGWTMEACSPEVALSYDDRTFGSVDMISASGVSVVGHIGEREEEPTRSFRLKGATFDPEGLRSPRQEVLDVGEDWIDITVTSPAWSTEAAPVDVQELAVDLASTTYIQSDHPDMVKRARSITRDARNDTESVEAIYSWVHRKVQKLPTVSLPSALDVLKNMQGDCNEHTYLFVALARAVNLPAKVRVGIVYVDGYFGYHAWPAVYLNGEWTDLDPTLGQRVVDSTHISLLEGELENQMMLVQYLGQLSVEVIVPGSPTDDDKTRTAE
jgi:hypothetical protein